MPLRQKYWLQVFLWVGLIYSTLGIVRPICEYLKKTLPFDGFIYVLMGIVVLGMIIAGRKYFVFKRASSYMLLLIWLGLQITGWMIVKYPEERIHFLEYGFLGFLLVRALFLTWPDWRAYAGALVLGSLFGWIDEGIQEILPNRYYQWEDVLLNVAATFLGVLLTAIINQEIQK